MLTRLSSRYYVYALCLLVCFRATTLKGITINSLEKAVTASTPPFAYPLHLTFHKAPTADAGVMVYLHGAGSSVKEAAYVHAQRSTPHHTVAFDFPDAHCNLTDLDPANASFGTIRELLPALYVIKQCVINAGLKKLHVCGFSAGGAALINLMGILNTTRYDEQLAAIGITPDDKRNMLAALQQGHIILNCPLKSIEELIAARGNSPLLDAWAKRYATNGFRPLDAIQHLSNLKLTVLLHFQEHDETLSNRDDALFYNKLKNVIEASGGTVTYVRGRDGGHNVYHKSLWRAYAKLVNGKFKN